MGDGRYYTLLQFANVFVLTCTIGAMLVMTTVLYLKKNKEENHDIMVYICNLSLCLLDEFVF